MPARYLLAAQPTIFELAFTHMSYDTGLSQAFAVFFLCAAVVVRHGEVLRGQVSPQKIIVSCFHPAQGCIAHSRHIRSVQKDDDKWKFITLNLMYSGAISQPARDIHQIGVVRIMPPGNWQAFASLSLHPQSKFDGPNLGVLTLFLRRSALTGPFRLRWAAWQHSHSNAK